VFALEHLVALVFTLFFALAPHAFGAGALSQSAEWQRIYQNRDVTNSSFYFSTDPDQEWEQAIHAFANPETLWGTQKLPAACVFPARKRILESLLGRKFPNPPCPDLTEWLSRIDADQIYLVYVGAYSGNPASILGHTFLRFSNKTRESSGREGMDLLSYAMGFQALADPRDARMLYMLKGLTGGYFGSYEIEPHYMKVGIYNNSESRDLWERRLNLTPDQVQLLLMHLWELTFNAQIRYYFIDENCSFRLITFLEAILVNMDISQHLGSIVLPAETVRAIDQAGWLAPEMRFRPSILRKIDQQLSPLTSQERRELWAARRSREALAKINDWPRLDALMNYWLYINYKTQTQLSNEQRDFMEAAFHQAAQQKTSAPSLLKTATETPPFGGHKPRFTVVSVGWANSSAQVEWQFRSGVHPIWSADPGYQDVTSIEYLGWDLRWRDGQPWKWSLLGMDARSTENAFGWNFRPSWSFESRLQNSCGLCGADGQESSPVNLLTSGGYGVGFRMSKFMAHALLHAESHLWESHGAHAVIAPGFAIGFKWTILSWTLAVESEIHWWKSERSIPLTAYFTRTLGTQTLILLKTQWERRDESVTLGAVRFF